MSAVEVFSGCSVASLDEFGARFSSCQHAFRLELLSVYAEESEQPFFLLHQQGTVQCPPQFNLDWIDILTAARGRDAKFHRARFRPPGALSAYMKFEYEWGYARNSQAGETILEFGLQTLSKIRRALGFLGDYWLFDHQHCYLIVYDVDGQFLGAMNVSPSDTRRFAEAEEIALAEGSIARC